MTFKTYSYNSAQVDYGELSYNAAEFYFYDTEYTYSRSLSQTANKAVNYLSGLTGYFPKGRVVEVTRNIDYTTTTADGDNIAKGASRIRTFNITYLKE